VPVNLSLLMELVEQFLCQLALAFLEVMCPS
jgi:hypothetical protein